MVAATMTHTAAVAAAKTLPRVEWGGLPIYIESEEKAALLAGFWNPSDFRRLCDTGGGPPYVAGAGDERLFPRVAFADWFEVVHGAHHARAAARAERLEKAAQAGGENAENH